MRNATAIGSFIGFSRAMHPDHVTGALMASAVLILVGYAVAETRRIRNAPPRHIVGWWHNIKPGDEQQRWNPEAWEDACDQSTRQSRKRRGIDA